jgi:uncharacterized Zn finger protein (UPF0148 family)
LIEDNFESPYQQMKRDRFKINYIGIGSETTKKIDWCPTNVCKVRMVLNKEGNIMCPECGLTITKEQQQKEQQQKQLPKLNLKQNDKPITPIIISQKRRGKDKPKFDSVNNELTDEDKISEGLEEISNF